MGRCKALTPRLDSDWRGSGARRDIRGAPGSNDHLRPRAHSAVPAPHRRPNWKARASGDQARIATRVHALLTVLSKGPGKARRPSPNCSRTHEWARGRRDAGPRPVIASRFGQVLAHITDAIHLVLNLLGRQPFHFAGAESFEHILAPVRRLHVLTGQ